MASRISSQAQWQDIKQTYDKAEQSGAIYQIQTKPEKLEDAKLGLSFVIQIAEALRDKPKSPKKSSEKEKDAFQEEDVHLTVNNRLSDTHMLRLNKFNVVPYHSLVITRDFEPQANDLTEADWTSTWAIMSAYPDGAIAYFNSGKDAGASQPRKHLQILPSCLDGNRTAPLPLRHLALESGKESGHPPLAAFELRAVPFQCFASLLPEGVTGGQLQQAYSNLMEARPLSTKMAEYNILATRKTMLLIPRSKEKCGPVSCNALIFAGTLLVRSTEELDWLREQGPMNVLENVTFPWDS